MAPFPPAGKPEAPDPATLRRFREWLSAELPRTAEPPRFAFAGDPAPGPVSLAPPFRPAATPTCAGLTPGFRHLVTEVRRRPRTRLRAALRTERQVRAGQVAQLARENGELRAALDRVFAEVAAIRADRPGGGGRD